MDPRPSVLPNLYCPYTPKNSLQYFFAFEVGEYTNRQQISHTIFQTKLIPLTLWKAYNHVIQFNFTFAHFFGKTNTTVDHLTFPKIFPKEKLIFRIRKHNPTTPIHLHVHQINCWTFLSTTSVRQQIQKHSTFQKLS